MKIACCLFALLLVLTACEDVIQVNLDEGDTLLVVDAFLNDQDDIQTVRLSLSAPYLSDAETEKVSNADVRLVRLENGVEHIFKETVAGVYQWRRPAVGDFATVGSEYELQIEVNGDVYRARSNVYPVPPVDSIVYFYEEETPFQEAGYQAYFVAFDLEGQTDHYFIRSYKNGVLRSGTADLEVCVDAAYGAGADGLQFIEPIADFTPGDDPYREGDIASVEIASIDKRTYDFLSQLKEQTANSGLFARPPANVPSNIESDSGEPRLKAVGWFAVSALSSASISIQAE